MKPVSRFGRALGGALVTFLGLPALLAQGADSDPFAFDLAADAAEPSALTWDGELSLRNRYASESSGWLSNRLRLELDARYQGKNWRLFANGYADYDRATRDYQDSGRAELHEAYVLVERPSLDLTAGKKIIAWGAADGRSTIDRINAVDLRDPISNGRTLARLPSWLLALQQQTQFGIWEAVWLPVGRQQRLAEFGSPWETPDLHQLRSSASHGTVALDVDNPRRDEGGIRFTRYRPGLDWGLAVFNGFTDLPVVQRVVGNRITVGPARTRTWSANMALGFANSTLRGELSYTDGFPVGLGAGKGLTQFIAGWDRTYLNNLYINLQGYVDDLAGVGRDYGLTFAASKPFVNGSLEAGLRGQLANRGQYSLELYTDYSLDDHYSLTFKIVAFDGDAGSALGAYKRNDFVELTLRYGF